jgi:hypothetical protein
MANFRYEFRELWARKRASKAFLERRMVVKNGEDCLREFDRALQAEKPHKINGLTEGSIKKQCKDKATFSGQTAGTNARCQPCTQFSLNVGLSQPRL